MTTSPDFKESIFQLLLLTIYLFFLWTIYLIFDELLSLTILNFDKFGFGELAFDELT